MRFAVLGCGSIGQRHLENLKTLNIQAISAYDPAADRRKSVESNLAIPVVSTLSQVWETNPDAVLITAPTHLHMALAKEVVDHRCHLFVEKPLATDEKDLKELSQKAEANSLITLVGCNMRFHPGPKLVKQCLDTGRIGRPVSARLHTGSYMPTWRSGTDFRKSYSASTQQGGGAILDQIHEVDLAFWLFGPFNYVMGDTVNADWLDLEVEGIAEMVGRHESGVLSSIHLNFVQRDYHRSIMVIGTEGSLYWEFGALAVHIFEAGSKHKTEIPIDSQWQLNDMYLDEMSHFITCLKTKEQTCCPLNQGAQVLKTALAFKRAVSEKRMIVLEA